MLKGNLIELNLANPPQNLQLKVGDTCRFTTRFGYSGPAILATLHVAMGNVGFWGFDEILHESKRWSIPATPTPKNYEAYADVYISSAISPGRYDVYAKLMEIAGYTDVFSPTYEDIIEIVTVAPPPEWRWYSPGNYTQIGILAPDKAPSGSTVEVEISLKNTYSATIHIWPGSTRYNTTVFHVYDAAGLMHVWVDAGAIHSWFGSFTMPNNSVTLKVESWYEAVDGWHADYSVTQTISRM